MTAIERAMRLHSGTHRKDWLDRQGAAVHRTADVHETAEIGAMSVVGPHVSIAEGVSIGAWVSIGEGVSIAQTPLYVVGYCQWPVYVGTPGKINVGCEGHSPDEWRANIDAIAEEHDVSDAEKSRVLKAVEVAAAWLADNPAAVTM